MAIDMRNITPPGQKHLFDDQQHTQVLANVLQEGFCWEYVRNGNNGRYAYKSVSPEVGDASADVMACKWLRKDKIKARIEAIQQELRNRWRLQADDLMEYHGRVVKTDRRGFFDAAGVRIPIHLLTDDLAAIVDIDSQYVKDCGVVMFPRVADKCKSAVEMARILGLHKDKVELTGKDGGKIETESVVKIYIPENGRD